MSYFNYLTQNGPGPFIAVFVLFVLLVSMASVAIVGVLVYKKLTAEDPASVLHKIKEEILARVETVKIEVHDTKNAIQKNDIKNIQFERDLLSIEKRLEDHHKGISKNSHRITELMAIHQYKAMTAEDH